MPRPRLNVHLYCDGGGWGLPTIDADGLSVHAMLRFSDVDYATTTGTSRSMTESRESPVLVISNDTNPNDTTVTSGLSSILAQLKTGTQLGDPDADLTPFMAAESAAFTSLVFSKIAPLRQHELYRDNANYADIHPLLLPKDASFPISRLQPYLHRRAILQALGPVDTQSARAAITALSTRLGDRNHYFYGDAPTALDAVVFGQLSIALMPLTRPRMRMLIAEHANLVAFIERIRDMYFPAESHVDMAAAAERADAHIRAEQRSARRKASTSESAEEHDRRVKNGYFVWGAVAVFAAHLLLASEIEFGLD